MKKQKHTKVIVRSILTAVVVIAIIILIVSFQKPDAETTPATTHPTAGEGTLSADQVDEIPDMAYAECMTEIKATNPDMSNADAKDNCLAIDAVNKANSSLCQQIINPGIKQACLAQF